MKLGDSFYLRGSLAFPTTGTANLNLIADDGVPTFGFRILRFKIFPQTHEGQSTQYPDCMGYLSTNPPSLGQDRLFLADPAQMAWAMFDNTSGSGIESDPSFELIDDSVFVRELWLKGWVMPNTANSGQYNYFIEIQRVSLTDTEALVHLATEVLG